MGEVTFENYGKYAKCVENTTAISGRYCIQADAERRIVNDLISKLSIQSSDSLLDIGCNIGTVFIPLSFLVAQATAVDHPDCLARLQERFKGENVRYMAGNFLTLPFNDERYDKILSYSVLHCLRKDDLVPFVEKAISLLAPGGRLLLGDIPNTSLKQRFLDSDEGIRFQEEWNRLCSQNDSTKECKEVVDCKPDPDNAQFDDESVLALTAYIRKLGCSAYILPQNPELPFGHTREDILVIRPR
ncbi:Methyltransferase domain-containing protein [Paucidesulfovibrio gracilis DSM 16080]|uniref:Methyltransferase domain-containing protein n=1 Tax=Paucidesulfovibrio gracilis DSM 16080 TaxID=1121449 RepID=A0A1T4XSB3_9BACT|nr:class I SAM-dependent methyltransferase [Paucidesulfovibrio gracilis]SKA92018.1 Methyltransferase domain-containing protein [Paucidesulfovibrio gracilis DSM 16080]